jgi:hypothetical protein
MFVNDIQKTRNVWVPLQPEPLRIQIKSSMMVGTVSVSSNSEISPREEDGFIGNSNTSDTHNSNTQEGLKPCMCM